MLLIGQTGSGKTYMVRKLVERYMQGHKPDELKFAFFDLKQVEFADFTDEEEKQPYLLFDVQFGNEESFDKLDELKDMSVNRARNGIHKPQIFIYIEECDMACRDQDRFDEALVIINQNAKEANMKLIYSTSRAQEDTVSKRLLNSFDLILQGRADYKLPEYLGLTNVGQDSYGFVVNERQN